jgi:hypothetical protein
MKFEIIYTPRSLRHLEEIFSITLQARRPGHGAKLYQAP